LPEQGPFVVGAGLAVALERSVAEGEGIGTTTVGGKHLGSLRRFPARHGLGVAWTGVEDHIPEPAGLGPITALLRTMA